MGRPRLSDAAKQRASQSGKGKGNGRGKKAEAPIVPTQSSPTPSAKQTGKTDGAIAARKDLAVAGLPALTETDIAAKLPKINIGAYTIADPHKLPESLPQVSDAQLDNNRRLAKGAMNAQESEILALQVTSGSFKVIGQQAKTFGDGVRAVTEIEKTTGAILDLRNQQEVTSQKTTAWGLNIYKTDKEAAIAVHSKTVLDQQERLANTKAESTKADADAAKSELDQKLKKLGIENNAK